MLYIRFLLCALVLVVKVQKIALQPIENMSAQDRCRLRCIINEQNGRVDEMLNKRIDPSWLLIRRRYENGKELKSANRVKNLEKQEYVLKTLHENEHYGKRFGIWNKNACDHFIEDISASPQLTNERADGNENL